MKKVILSLSVIALSAIVFTSCKKTYECSCHTSAGGHEHINIEAKKNDAESACKALAVGSYTACEIE